MGFPMERNPPANAGDMVPWYSKIPWRRKWQPTPVFLPGKSHGERSHRVTKSRTQLSTAQHSTEVSPEGAHTWFHANTHQQEKGRTVTELSAWRFSSVQFSRSVVSNSLRPYESQHTRPPCPSPTPGVHPNSCASCWWCHPAILSSIVPFSSCSQSLSASGSFPMSQLFTWGGQSIGVSASASVLPMNTQDWSPLEWTGWISLQSKGLSRVFSNTTVQKHQFFSTQHSL